MTVSHMEFAWYRNPPKFEVGSKVWFYTVVKLVFVHFNDSRQDQYIVKCRRNHRSRLTHEQLLRHKKDRLKCRCGRCPIKRPRRVYERRPKYSAGDVINGSRIVEYVGLGQYLTLCRNCGAEVTRTATMMQKRCGCAQCTNFKPTKPTKYGYDPEPGDFIRDRIDVSMWPAYANLALERVRRQESAEVKKNLKDEKKKLKAKLDREKAEVETA